MSYGRPLNGKENYYMKKYENFCAALSNMKEMYRYKEPYDNVVLTGLVDCMRFVLSSPGK